ncbi:Ribonucleoprotein [Platanthera guangdongensis]|uniref:Ribonucleoprotein n=1 Tax=Platanthera guangdongensis TaxID=2320717 RepID=A0ABR2MA62_9ASPA
MKRSSDAPSKSTKNIAARDEKGNANKEPTCAPSKSSGYCTLNRSPEASQPTDEGRGSDREAEKCGGSCGERDSGRGDERGNDREAGRFNGSDSEFASKLHERFPDRWTYVVPARPFSTLRHTPTALNRLRGHRQLSCQTPAEMSAAVGSCFSSAIACRHVRSDSFAKAIAVRATPFPHLRHFIEQISVVAATLPQVRNLPRMMSAAVAQEEDVSVAQEEAAAVEKEPEEEELQSTKLYFGNLSYHCDSAQLAGIIQENASPETVEVLYDRDSGRSRGFAFETMSSVEDCEAVISKLDGTVECFLPITSSQQKTNSFHKIFSILLLLLVYSNTVGER